MMKLLTLIALLMFFCACQHAGNEVVTLFIAGDSTAADKPYGEGNPEKGWGQILPLYFESGVVVDNHARNGRSTKSFIDEGRWDSLISRVKTGDYVIIQFGHNDSKINSPERYAEAFTDYSDNLRRFIADVKTKGGNPIIASSIVRRHFDANGALIQTHGDYPEAAQKIAEETGVLFFDLHSATREMVQRYGSEFSKALYLHIDTIEYVHLSKSIEDDTHLSAYGAFKVCDLIVGEIKNRVPELADLLSK
jgi:lysophospholipase L1-like esterase